MTMRALFPELRTIATSADPSGISHLDDAVHTASESPRSPSAEGHPLQDVIPLLVHIPPDVAAPILAPANSSVAANHEEELLRSPAAEGLLNAALLNSHPPLVDAVAQVGQHS